MNLRHVFFLLYLVSAVATAKTAFVANNLDLPLRSKESPKSRLISFLTVGTPVEVISENSKSGFTLVQLKSGQQGYIASKNIVSEPPANANSSAISASLSSLQTENDILKEELAKLKTSISPDTPLEQTLTVERDRLDRELTELKKTAANQIQLKNERDTLQEDVVNVKRELEQLKLENNALKDGAKLDWFLYGGMLSLSGVILGFILPKLSWRRKNSWDRL
ncbi:hypothetical protein MCAMS1_01924 [biofilm metagenome]